MTKKSRPNHTPEKEPKTIGERLAWARKAKDMTQMDVVTATGAHRSTVSAWERDDSVPHKRLFELADLYGVTVPWLLTGKGPVSIDDPAIPHIEQTIPLLDWDQAKDYVTGKRHKDDSLRKIAIPNDLDLGDRGFGIFVVGDAMYNRQTGEGFPDKTVLYVEGDREPKYGDYVVVQRPSQSEAFFKQLVKDGQNQLLKPINPQYPIEEFVNHFVLGVVKRTRLEQNLL